MSSPPREYLLHILAEADYLLAQSKGLTPSEFLSNETLRRAFVRSIEIISEATKKVPADYRKAHAEIDRRRMAGMRRLIHDYFGVDYELVWDVVQESDPKAPRVGLTPRRGLTLNCC